MEVAVVGSSSFLAAALRDLPETAGWRWLSHRDALADSSWTQDVATVLNFAFCPDFKTTGYEAGQDIDRRLAAMIADGGARYVMISSRMVYGEDPDDFVFREDRVPRPVTPYGQAKLAVEHALVSMLGQARVTIVRPSNIFGHEYGRRSFFGMALAGLRDHGEIVFDMGPDTVRDFLAVWRFTPALAAIVKNPRPGIYNLGAGFGISCGQVAQWLIEGYGAGRLVVTDPVPKSQFQLDMGKARADYGLSQVTAAMLREDCLQCGAQLRATG